MALAVMVSAAYASEDASSEPSHVVAYHSDDRTRVWDAIIGDELHSFEHKHIIRACSFSEDADSIETPLDMMNEERDQLEQIQQERAMKISNVANVLLLAFKIYATIKSGSLAIAGSTLDLLLDLIIGGILWFTHLLMKNVNIYQYPIGKLRVQPVGILIFAAVMATLGFQVLTEAVQQLIRNESSLDMSFEQLLWLYVIMGSASVVKFVLWIYCRSSRNRIVCAYAKVSLKNMDKYLDDEVDLVWIFGDDGLYASK